MFLASLPRSSGWCKSNHLGLSGNPPATAIRIPTPLTKGRGIKIHLHSVSDKKGSAQRTLASIPITQDNCVSVPMDPLVSGGASSAKYRGVTTVAAPPATPTKSRATINP